jgi:(R,R)-butanediol dehydrogenase/meso-butanediol dehydrogenase/diacetyl reductase
VKVKIFGTGICGTDLNVLKGKMNATHHMIMGHRNNTSALSGNNDISRKTA